MRKCVLILVAILLFSPHKISSAPGDVTRKMGLSFHHPTGVAWNGQEVWIADRKTDMFYALDESGAVKQKLPSPGYFPSGLAWDGNWLWSTDPADGKIYATDVKTGQTVRTLDSPGPSPTGITWDGKWLWICDNRLDQILKIDPGDGTTIVSFPSPATDPRGITFGEGYLWCSDRIRDKIYMVHPENGMAVMILDAPGPFTWGLAWKEGMLLNADYQDDTLYQLVVQDADLYKTYEPRTATVEFTTEAVALGEGSIDILEIFYAVPSDLPHQKLLAPLEYSIPPAFEKDRWDQQIALFRFEGMQSGDKAEVSLRARLETSAIRYFIFPEKVGKKIPDKIRKLYLADEVKYDIQNSYIQELVKKVTAGEDNLYWKARKLYQYLIENMEYQLAGGWNTAPTVLKRKNGSCSEYSFSYIALCRAAGIPARYVGSLVVRGDEASYDDVFHRWNEIYLPSYGWVPVDANAGDKDLPADQCAAFGGISNRFLVTTAGGGNSEYLGWSYNHENRWVSSGKCRLRLESTAEWEPVSE
ncbi:MAG: transglutaminase [Candidatus Krumholzibacteriota bacterium]|nr:transglutaminase [Candidatus Krumholzibacteriota bacterium]